ncbi:hypothetical protein DFJ77DRAFT_236395 [Powellomyces hirtus]|nr:hypothetical protein DFJ77DRAFT_236395 [Powellomyces hirtus]
MAEISDVPAPTGNELSSSEAPATSDPTTTTTNDDAASTDEASAPRDPPANVDLAVIVTPAQAMELNRRAEEIKHGYALLAMKRIENAFAGLDDDPDAPGDGAARDGEDAELELKAEEEKLNAAMASYSQHMEECGIPNGSPEYLAAMDALARAQEAESQPPTAAVEEETTVVEKPAKPVEDLPYHDVWKHANPADATGDAAAKDAEQFVATVVEAPVVAVVVVEPTAPPAAELTAEVKTPMDENPEPVEPKEATPAPAAAAAAPRKKLPPVVRPARGRATRIPFIKQSIPTRTLALSFTSFPTAFPGDAQQQQQAHHSPPANQQSQPQFPVTSTMTFNSPYQQQQQSQQQQYSQQQQLQQHRTGTASSSISQIPLDANALRAVHPIASSTRGVVMSPLTGGGISGHGTQRQPPGGVGSNGMLVMNTGPRYQWTSHQQQNQKRGSAQIVGGVSHAVVAGTGMPPGAAAGGTSAKFESVGSSSATNTVGSPAASVSLAPRTANTAGAGSHATNNPAPTPLDHLPPIKNSPSAQKLALQAGGASRRAGGAAAH